MPGTGGKSEPRPSTHFRLKIAGKEAAGLFREVTGLNAEVEVIETAATDENGNNVVLKVPGKLKTANIELKRGVDVKIGLWEWFQAVRDKGPDAARADCTLQRLDYDGKPTASYVIKQAWPMKYDGGAFNAGANEIAVESLTLCHEGLERT